MLSNCLRRLHVLICEPAKVQLPWLLSPFTGSTSQPAQIAGSLLSSPPATCSQADQVLVWLSACLFQYYGAASLADTLLSVTSAIVNTSRQICSFGELCLAIGARRIAHVGSSGGSLIHEYQAVTQCGSAPLPLASRIPCINIGMAS